MLQPQSAKPLKGFALQFVISQLESDITGQSWILLGESGLQHKSLYNQISAIKLLASEGDLEKGVEAVKRRSIYPWILLSVMLELKAAVIPG